MSHSQIDFVGIHKLATSWILFFLCARFSIVAVDVLAQILLLSIKVRKWPPFSRPLMLLFLAVRDFYIRLSLLLSEIV